MYSKLLTESSRKYLLDTKQWIKRDKVPAIPVSQTKGMRDIVRLLTDRSGIDLYSDFHDRIMMDSALRPGGYLEPKSWFFADGFIITHDDLPFYIALMRGYDKYLCTDGVIRYRPSPESERKFNLIYEKEEQEFWDGINACFEAMGMFYNEDEGVWINPETGEEGCY